MSINERNLLDYFGVKSHKELIEYMRKNPNDKKVIELKELLKEFDADVKEEGVKWPYMNISHVIRRKNYMRK